jgi:hypothetical protein
MALKAVKPTEIEKRLKLFLYGNAGVGKTTAAISFPNVYLIDTEKGAIHSQYVKLLEKSNGAIFNTSDFNEVIAEIKSLLTEKHDYKTLVIDPLTTIYNDLVDKSAIKNGTEYGRHYSEANKQMKHLVSLLLRLDMNVIITSHSKTEYGQNLSVLGQTFDCYKKLDYMFDLVLEIQKRGKDRVGFIKKTRLEGFPDGESFPFGYDYISDKYGKNILEKESMFETLASIEQIEEFNRLVELFQVPEESIQKWLDKANSGTVEEMSSENIDKCIDFLKKKIKGVA